jgi:CheY-like chemotaxis protein
MESARRLRVLVVDDNEDAATALATLVALWGYEIRTAFGGLTALIEAEDFLPDVVLCDLEMPGVDGCRVVEALRQDDRFSKAFLVAVTAYGDEEHRRRALNAGFHAHLVKPVNELILHRLLRSHPLGD